MAKTSHVYNELLKLLGQSKDWADIRHLHTLIWMVIGLICSGCINLTKWTIYVDSRAKFAQSHQRRFSRWLQNSRINVQRLYSPIIQAALSQWGSQEIVLTLGYNDVVESILPNSSFGSISGTRSTSRMASHGASECERIV